MKSSFSPLAFIAVCICFCTFSCSLKSDVGHDIAQEENRSRARNASILRDRFRGIADNIGKGQTAACAVLSNVLDGGTTELGALYRRRIEEALRQNGVEVKIRKDLGLFIDDMETYNPFRDNREYWTLAEAQAVLIGDYRIRPAKGEGDASTIFLDIRAWSADESLIGRVSWTESLEDDWEALETTKIGSVKREWKQVVGSGSGGANLRPMLSVEFDKDRPCYLPDTPIRLLMETDPGNHLYIFGIHTDRTGTMLYPNGVLPQDQKLATGTFEFPPGGMEGEFPFEIELAPGEVALMAVKVVACGHALDFSFLPDYGGYIFKELSERDLKRVEKTVADAGDRAEVEDLSLVCSRACR